MAYSISVAAAISHLVQVVVYNRDVLLYTTEHLLYTTEQVAITLAHALSIN